MKYLIIVEKAKSGYSAYWPDLPGCVATGPTRHRALDRMQSAIQFHLDGIRAEGRRVPAPKSFSTYIEVSARPHRPLGATKTASRRRRAPAHS
jgi:predicted RNase H-like HicB family nuclease